MSTCPSPSEPLPAFDDRPVAVARPGLQRGLTVRRIQFMALGSAIGTGLFYGSSAAIQAAGPFVLLAYIVAGGAVFMVMRAMGEMAVRILLFYVLALGIVMTLVPAQVFHAVASLATFATVWVWLMILLSHLAMRRRLAREGVRADLFPVPLWPVASYAALAFIIGVIVLLAVFPDTRIALVVGAVWLLAMWGGYEATIGRAQRLSRL